jgi:chemotaxis regulatin CheY-phosphate phosphatase CheZ
VDRVFGIIEEMNNLNEGMQKSMDGSKPAVDQFLEEIADKIAGLYEANMEFNSSQQIQDRIGQQMLKIILSIKVFHDQLLKIANKLNLNWGKIEPDDDADTRVGYGGAEGNERVEQSDVDDLLSSLGL